MRKKMQICIYDLTPQSDNHRHKYFRRTQNEHARSEGELFTTSKYFAKPRRKRTEEIGCHLENAYPTIFDDFSTHNVTNAHGRITKNREIRLLSHRVISASSFPSKWRGLYYLWNVANLLYLFAVCTFVSALFIAVTLPRVPS